MVAILYIHMCPLLYANDLPCVPPSSLPSLFPPLHSTPCLLCALSFHTVHSTYGIVCLRRRLERDPHTFSPSPPRPFATRMRPRHIFDPP